MSKFARLLRQRVLAIDHTATSLDVRGFHAASPQARQALEAAGRSFVDGYNAALEVTAPDGLAARLQEVDRPLRGFAYEGAAMALALLDGLLPGRGRRLGAFLAGPGDPHAYMVHVGAGWAMARLPARLRPRIEPADPLLRWLALDGLGFHQCYFHPARYATGRYATGRAGAEAAGKAGGKATGYAGYAGRAFDQGVGRALWFVHGADVGRIAAAIEGFPAGSHADLWSGVGLAASYAGGVGVDGLRALRAAAGHYLPHVAQGCAFAAKARLRAGIPTEHTELAAAELCGTTAAEAAAVTDNALTELPAGDQAARGAAAPEPAYETWRRRIRDHFAHRPAVRLADQGA